MLSFPEIPPFSGFQVGEAGKERSLPLNWDSAYGLIQSLNLASSHHTEMRMAVIISPILQTRKLRPWEKNTLLKGKRGRSGLQILVSAA